MMRQIVRPLRRAVLSQIVRRGGQIAALLTKNARVKGGVRQHADAKDHVGGILVRVDKIIGQRQLDIQPRIARRQQQPRATPLAEKTGALMRIVPEGSVERASSSRRASSKLVIISPHSG